MKTKIIKIILMSAVAVIFYFIGGFNICSASALPVRISEAYYNPSVSDDTGLEWIKIYNPNDTEADISGYDLYTGKYYTFDNLKIQAKKFITVHINLVGTNTPDEIYTGTNNQANMSDISGSVALFSSSIHSKSTIIDFVQYGSGGKTWQTAAVDAGIWSKDDFVPKTDIGYVMRLKDVESDNNSSADWESYQISIILEDEDSVELADEEEIDLLSIFDARLAPADQFVRVVGTVTVIPGKLSDQYFYIEDNSGGIQIYCYKKDFPKLEVGNQIEVVGQISSYYTDVRLKIADAKSIVILGHADPTEPQDIEITQIDDSKVGELIEIEGEVSKTSGDTFYLEDVFEIKISIKEETGINKPRMAVGDRVRIIGVVSKYKNTYQVLPFEQSGVTILTSGELPAGGKNESKIPETILFLSIWKLSPITKKKLLYLQKTTPKS